MSPRTPLQTLATQLTACRASAIATLAVRGPRAVEIVRSQVRLSVVALQLGRVYYGEWRLACAHSELVEQVVVCRTAPETIEVHCHGGVAICRALLQQLQAAGCRLVAAADWPLDDCPLQRAAREDLLNTTTDRTAAILLDQMNGALTQRIEHIVSFIETGDATSAATLIEDTLRWRELGKHLTNPWRVVLAGPPNVGKSSLANAIAGSQRAIVHSQPGTTRDWQEILTAIDGWPIAITDTAGLREAGDDIERQGIQRARQQLDQADLAVLVVDAQVGWTETHSQLLQLPISRWWIAWNKWDLLAPDVHAQVPGESKPLQAGHPVERAGVGVTSTSCSCGTGIAELTHAISHSLVPASPPPDAPLPFRPDHMRQLTIAQGLLTENQPAAAQDALQSLGAGKGAGVKRRNGPPGASHF